MYSIFVYVCYTFLLYVFFGSFLLTYIFYYKYGTQNKIFLGLMLSLFYKLCSDAQKAHKKQNHKTQSLHCLYPNLSVASYSILPVSFILRFVSNKKYCSC